MSRRILFQFPRIRGARKVISVALFVALAASLLGVGPSGHYDEVYDENGNPRPGYERIVEISSKLTDERKQAIRKNTRLDLQDDNEVLEVPRWIDAKEYDEVIKPGIAQRGSALMAFLKDYYSGEKRYQKDPRFSADLIDRIIARNGDAMYRNNVDSLAFPYGPDLSRGPDGVWRVIEDSVGPLGGDGDLLANHEALLRHVPEYAEILKQGRDPTSFYRDRVQLFTKLRNPPDGVVVALLIPQYGDHENERLAKIYQNLGVVVVDHENAKNIFFKDQVPYVRIKGADGIVKEERIGFLINNTEHEFLDTTHFYSFFRSLVSKMQYFAANEKSYYWSDVVKAVQTTLGEMNPMTGLPKDTDYLWTLAQQIGYDKLMMSEQDRLIGGLIAAIESGALPSNYSPGVDFLNDKQFYMYVEDMIRFYLHEEPILRSIRTRTFAKADGSLDKDLLSEVKSDPKRNVVKEVENRGGKGVFVGAKIPESEFKIGLKGVKANPANFIDQDYVPLSVSGNSIVDMRVHSVITAKAPPLISDTPWGRTTPIDSDGKVNLSNGGSAQVVTVQRGDEWPARANSRARKKILDVDCVGKFKSLKRIHDLP